MAAAVAVAVAATSAAAAGLSVDDLLDDAVPAVSVPVPVHVFLVGLSDKPGAESYAVHSDHLQQLLARSLPDRVPGRVFGSGPSGGGGVDAAVTALGVRYALQYDVRNLGQAHAEQLAQRVAATLRPAADASAFGGADGAVYDASTDGVEGYLSDVLDTEHAGAGRPYPPAIVIMHLDKSALLPGAPARSSFTYRYGIGSGFASAWLAAGRFLVVDLSAGPVQYGPLFTDNGFVSPVTFPRVPRDTPPSALPASPSSEFASAVLADALFTTRLVAVVHSAVQSVLAPDAHTMVPLAADARTNPDADVGVIYVPVVVYTEIGTPTGGAGDADAGANADANAAGVPLVDTALLEEQLKPLLLPGHKLRFTTWNVTPSSAPDVAAAVQQALSGQPVYVATDAAGDTLRTRFRTCLDAAPLTRALRHAAGWSGGAGFAPLPSALRTVPVFVLRLPRLVSGPDQAEDALLGCTSAVEVADGVVVALAPPDGNPMPLPFTTDASFAHVPPAGATAQVLGGLAQALAHVTRPTQHWSHAAAHMVPDFTWAHGVTPFGPYAFRPQLSQAVIEAAQRNHAVLLLDTAVRNARAAAREMRDFCVAHVYDPLQDGANHTAAALSAMLRAVDDDDDDGGSGGTRPLPASVRKRLQRVRPLLGLVLEQLDSAGSYAARHSPLVTMDFARHLVGYTRDLHTTVHMLLSNASQVVQCCAKHAGEASANAPPGPRFGTGALVVVVVAVVACVVCAVGLVGRCVLAWRSWLRFRRRRRRRQQRQELLAGGGPQLPR